MHISVNSIDSRVFRQTVLDLSDITAGDDLAAMEHDYVAQHNPIYVCCKVPVENLRVIHALEDLGFRFVEYQLRMTYHVTNPFDESRYPYRFERVTTEEALWPVLEIASSAFTEDRFTNDPAIPRYVSGKRYRMYVIKSFSTEGENVYRLVRNPTDETVAFRTHRILNSEEAVCLLGAVHRDYQNTPLPFINEQFEFNALRARGISKIHTHISGRSLGEMNLEMGGVGFRGVTAVAVLRRWYGDSPKDQGPANQ